MAHRTILLFILLFNYQSILTKTVAQTFRQFSNMRNAPITAVLGITQDKSGFMWFATTSGLYRFDSNTFRKYPHDPNNPNSVVTDYISKVYCDSEGKIWASTFSGISLYDSDKGTFQNITHDSANVNSLASNYVFFVSEDSQGNIWAGTTNGLDRIKKVNGTLQVHKEDHISFLDIAGYARCMVEGEKGEQWVGSSNGLVYLAGNNSPPEVFKMESNIRQRINEFLSIKKDSHGNLWLGTGSGLVYFDTKSRKFELIEDFKHTQYPEPSIRNIIEDENGMFWITTESGLAYFNPLTRQSDWHLTQPGNPQSLADDVLYAAYLDERGGLWLGSYYLGISFLNTTSTKIHSWPSNTHIYTSGWTGTTTDNKLWMVSGDRSKLIFPNADPRKNLLYDIPLPIPTNYSAFYVDSKNVLWCGSKDNLTAFNLNTGTLMHQQFLLNGEKTVLTGRITGIYEGNDGNLRIYGSFGVLEVDKSNGNLYDTEVNSDVQTTFKDSKGNYWYGGSEQMMLQKKGEQRIEYLTISRVKTGNRMRVWGITEDLQGRIWVAAQHGLLLYDTDLRKFILISDKDKILGNVLDVKCDNLGFLWLYSETTLIRYHHDNQTIQVFDYHDGFPVNSILPPTSSLIDHNGILHFASNRHIFSLDPQSVKIYEKPSPIVISSLKLFNKEVELNDQTGLLNQPIDKAKKIKFLHHQNIFSLEFALLSFSRLEKNHYAYMLEGFEDEWNYTFSNSATYTNLPTGKYTFLVKAANGDGYWNEVPTRLGIEVLPPWWKTWFAYTAYLLLISALIYGIVRFLWLRKSVQKENELYQSKLDFFTNISHEIRTHLSLITNPLEKMAQSNDLAPTDVRYLSYARNNSNRLLQLVNELLDFRKIESQGLQLHVSEQNLVAVLTNVLSAFENIGIEKGIQTTVSLHDQSLTAWFDVLQMQKVFFNLLGNAYKFTPDGGQIHILIQQTPQNIQIQFKNSGKGIESKYLSKLFTNFFQTNDNEAHTTGYGIGLALAKAIVEQHQGDLNVSSRRATYANDGETTFTLTMLKGYSHYSDKQLKNEQSSIFLEPFNSQERFIRLDQSNSNHRRSLLIIEDNEELRAFAIECFNSEYQVLEAANGADGLEIAREKLPDIIICDIMMPKLDGISLCRTLKTDALTCHIPIILLTARGSSQQITEGLQTGADDFLVKPFDLKILQLKIHNLIKGREILRQKYRNTLALEPEEIVSNDVDNEFIRKLKELVIEKLSDPQFGVNDMAFQTGVSVSVLYRKVRAITGMTVNEFTKTIRMKRAKQLLLSGNYQVNEVALIVGFEDRKYFSKEFRKLYGKSPMEIKKLNDENIHVE